MMENTFSSLFFLSQERGGGVVVEHTYVTLCLLPSQPSGSEGQTDDIHKERERLRLVLKQMGRIKCPSEVCSTSFPSLIL